MAHFVPDSIVMPPPPLPPSVSSPTRPPPLNDLPPRSLLPSDVTSPTTSFANLSLLSPLVNGPAPHFPGSFSRSFPKPTSPSPLSHPPHPVFRENTNSPHLVQAQVAPPSSEEKSILGSPFVRREAVLSAATLPSHPPLDQSPRSPSPPPSHADEHAREARSSPSPIPPSPRSDTTALPQHPNEDVVDIEKEMEDDAHAQPSPQQPLTDLVPMAVDSPAEYPIEEDVFLEETLSVATEALSPDNTASIEPEMDRTLDVSPHTLSPAPSPAPPPKVKLSLKDFAMRKKKRREEEQAAASPVVSMAHLHDDGASPRTLASEPTPSESKDTPQSTPSLGSNAMLPEVSPPEAHAEPSFLKQSSAVLSSEHDPKPEPVISPPATVPSSQDNVVNNEPTVIPEPEQIRVISPEQLEERPRTSVDMDVDRPRVEPMSFEAKLEAIEPKFRYTQDSLRADKFSPSPRTRTPTPPPSIRSPMMSPPSTYAKRDGYDNPFSLHRSSTDNRRIQQPLARQISQEDGEIFSPPAPKPLPLAPRSHTPPTHPRSFHPPSGGTSPVRGPPPAPPRRTMLSAYRPQPPQSPVNSRPLPSGPRALRGVGGGGPPYQPPSYPSSFSSSRSDGPHMAPRGPSADRDRDRVDWDRDRGRPGSWGRSRGGSWVR